MDNSTIGSRLVARWFVENKLPNPYTTRDLEDLVQRIDGLAIGLRSALLGVRRDHLVIEDDNWYSCPKSGHCINEALDRERCNCGADDANRIIDVALAVGIP